MIKNCVVGLVLLLISLAGHAQEGLVQIEPASAVADQQIKITYDASLGDSQLTDAPTVYMHSGVVTSGPDGTSWQYVVGDYGSDNGVGAMTAVPSADNTWEITLTPTARDYYGVPAGENIFRLAMVFRNADGSAKGAGTPGTYSWGSVASNGDIYIDLAVEQFVQITSPATNTLFLEEGQTVPIAIEASADVTSMSLSINEGAGFEEVATVSDGTTLAFTYAPESSVNITLRAEASIEGINVQAEKSVDIFLVAVEEAPLPEGIRRGINYTGATSATLVLEAPLKEFVYVVGDFTDWNVLDDYRMKRDPGTGWFWIELDQLEEGKKYVFQYWVEGTIRIGDPYADEVADAENDPFISEDVFADIAPYDKAYGPATVLQTGRQSFNWAGSEMTWEAPPKEELVIYELLLRDFMENHTYDDLIDTLGYLKRLGVNAIELMPIMEFEGNLSWGYNVSYFFAPDKYYGTREALKRFVQAAHAEGFAVIMDMVLNHAFGQNPMVRMYFENGKPTEDSPWFNTDARHPFNVGFDFNHESEYTQDFVDSVNNYWLTEYHIDGFRFDLSKGFTQNFSSNVDTWSSYDASRVTILKRMAEALWDQHEDAYIILEHFAAASEENELAAEGMLPWRNMHYSGHSSLTGPDGDLAGANDVNYISYLESHDEERIMYEAYLNGVNEANYNTSDTTILLERHKMLAAFFLMLKGPKMIWQFGELGYDYLLNGPNGENRLEMKPLPWGAGNLGYYEDPLRQYLLDAYSAVIDLKTTYGSELNAATYTTKLNGSGRHIVIDGSSLDFVLVGNFDRIPVSHSVTFPETGTWYDYFGGEELAVNSTGQNFELQPGEFYIFTSTRLSDGFEDVVEIFEFPVTVSPDPFSKDTPITIRFDASKGNAAGTEGLVGASEVVMVSGVVTSGSSGEVLEHLVDNASGSMSPVENEPDVWEITLTASDYYGLESSEEIFRIGMYFRNGDGSGLGKGFRGSTIFLSVELEGGFIQVTPAAFDQEDEITITYDARFGPLSGASKVYLHSGVVLSDVAQPVSEDWTHVQGNWGSDDGVGEMQEVNGSPGRWQITLTPSSYYGISQDQQAWWIAMVFRNADGTVQEAPAAGSFDTYYVASNGDLFYRIPGKVVSSEEDLALKIFPNPSTNRIYIAHPTIDIRYVELLNMRGQRVLEHSEIGNDLIELNTEKFESGLYILRIHNARGETLIRKLILTK